ncbi:MAG: hypothetical protein RLZZ352_1739 [Pseudomonadota bacterium]|jgi:hypothetical protein
MSLVRQDKLAVFVDMDNLSVTGLETVLSRWRYRQTPLTLRRAYGGLDKLKGASAVLQRYGFHVRANHGRGTTDVLLTVDVMDALHAGLLPSVVAIASSDADFVPLVWRLRDAGIRVVGVAERVIANVDALTAAYDDMEWCDEFVSAPPVTVNAQAAIPASLSKSEQAPVHTSGPKSVSVSSSAPAPAVPMTIPTQAAMPSVAPVNVRATESQTATAKSPAPVTLTESDLAKARALVNTLQPWLPDTVKQLQQIGSVLRERNLVTGNKPLHTHFRQFPGVFQVMPSTGAARMVKLLKLP